ncbi:DUF2513 domain-containing protein [Bacillus sp. Wb]
MKRDMDLIRKILIQVEEKENEYLEYLLPIEGYTEEEIQYHLRMISGQGLVNAHYADNIGRVTTLTWEGYEFLENIKNDTIWNKTKDVVKKNGGAASLAIMTELAKELALKHFLGK